MKDSKGNEINVGDRVLFATWGMFDVHESVWRKTDRYVSRRPHDEKHITHLNKGVIERILHDEDGSMEIKPDGINGVIHLCTKPSWSARPEFVERDET